MRALLLIAGLVLGAERGAAQNYDACYYKPCQNGAICVAGSEPTDYFCTGCDTNMYYGTNCEHSICSKMQDVFGGLNVCHVASQSTCIGNFTDAEICRCINGTSGVLCDSYHVQMPPKQTKCQREKTLYDLVITLLNTTATHAYRNYVNRAKLQELLTNIGFTQLHQRSCTASGMYEGVQCEVDVYNINSKKCYCAHSETGDVLPGYAKQYGHPTSCMGASPTTTTSMPVTTAAGEKDGQCPPPSGFGICLSECTSDQNCNATRKCCNNSCGGGVCMVPVGVVVPEKPGFCPLDTQTSSCPSITVMCTSDDSCANDYKCCSKNCWDMCSAPVNSAAVMTGLSVVLDMPFDQRLYDIQSPYYRSFEKKVKAGLMARLRSLRNFLGVSITGFMYGSVRVSYEVHFSSSDYDLMDTMNATNDIATTGLTVDGQHYPIPVTVVNTTAPTPPPCTLSCQSGYYCMLQEIQCARAPCHKYPQCVPYYSTTTSPPFDPCSTMFCMEGTTCVTKVVQCVTTPCYPVGECIPTACMSHPCLNGGSCTPDEESDYTCTCPTGISGVNCENGATPRPSKCALPQVVGPCKAYMRSWFHNSTSNRCEEFVYGGCQGNDNRFESEGVCKRECKAKSGKCPMVPADAFGACGESCTTDLNCYGNQKCCSNGCGHTCQNPATTACMRHPCLNGGSCMPGQGQNTYTCMCPTGTSGVNCERMTKPGMCPSPVEGMSGICVESCQTDYNCSGNQKCCSNGCGHTCQNPASMTKPGMCPSPVEGMSGICVESCKTDYNCSGNQKCCSNGCGHTCQNPATTACMRHPCLNGGSCMPGQNPNTYTCTCPTGISGVNCENGATPRPSKCALPRVVGPCRAYIRSWFYNSTSNRCEEFVYGGCQGNDNRFDSEEICKQECKAKSGKCPMLPPGTVGTCVESCTTDLNCYGKQKCCSNGCGHTCQNPATMSDVCMSNPCMNGGSCMAGQGHNTYTCTCPSGYTGVNCEHADTARPSKCMLPKVVGPCKAYYPSWFYNSTSNKCEKFVYGGCQGNDNRFGSEETCQQECKIKPGMCPSPMAGMGGICVESCKTDHSCSGNQKCCSNGCGHTCQNPANDTNMCAEGMWMCHSVKKCIANISRCNNYDDCGDNSDEADCKDDNPLPENCSLPYDTGPCRAIMERWYFNTATRKCEQFNYGGCLGNANRFHTEYDCQSNCKVKAGTCPNPPNGTFTMCAQMCSSDRSCHGNMKCCNYGCGLSCRSPVSIGNQCNDSSDCGAGSCENSYCRCNQGAFGDDCHNSTSPIYLMCDRCYNGGTCMYNYGNFQSCMCPAGYSGSSCSDVEGVRDSFKLDMPWRPDYYNPSSTYYSIVKSLVEENILRPAFSRMPNFQDVEVVGFFPGSVKVNYSVTLSQPVSNMSYHYIDQAKSQVENSSITLDGTVYKVIAKEKPGFCPPPMSNSTFGVCYEGCSDDGDCAHSMKCCSNGCGHTCQYPTHNTSRCFSYHDCENGGSCLSGYCWCPPGYTGTFCQSANYTYGYCTECQQGGSCMKMGEQRVRCICPPRYYGQFCEMQNGTSEKPGFCPPVSNGTFGACYEGCSDDGDCAHSMKCCSNGCGHTCQYPTNDSSSLASTITLNTTWQAWYAYPSSSQTFRNGIALGLRNVFSSVNNFKDVNVTGLRSGSVIVHFILMFYSAPDMSQVKAVFNTITSNGLMVNGVRYTVISRDDCRSLNSMCMNGGSCVQQYNGMHKCTCPAMYYGKTCEHYDINDCRGTYRECDSNGGSCQMDASGKHRCQCYNNFIGARCSQRDACASSPCNNNATCMNTPYSLEGYICNCREGYFGETCEDNFCSLFSPNPCQGQGSVCVGDLKNAQICSCAFDREGVFCEKQGYGEPSMFGCELHQRLGNYLRDVVNGAQSLPTLNYAKVNSTHSLLSVMRVRTISLPMCNDENSFLYDPMTCELDIRTNETHCFCVDERGDPLSYYRKPLSEGYPNCSRPCDSSPCQNGGTCYSYRHQVLCYCAEGFAGDRCQESFCSLLSFDPCTTYGGVCQPNFAMGQLCNCSTSYTPVTGVLCDKLDDGSMITPCEKLYNMSVVAERVLNGSLSMPGYPNIGQNLLKAFRVFDIETIQQPVCEASGEAIMACDMYVTNTNHKKCYCIDSLNSYSPVEGTAVLYNRLPDYCPREGDQCYDFQCTNNGSCVRSGDRSYCGCSSNYMGQYCQTYRSNPCDSNPCHQGRKCENSSDGSYSCACPREWGPNCENPPPDYCSNCTGFLNRCITFETCNSSSVCSRHSRCVGSEYSSPCDSIMSCNYRGKCIDTGRGNHYCECMTGYSGKNCKTNDRICDLLRSFDICGAGECVGDIDDGMLCRCPSDRRGAFCGLQGNAHTKCERQQDLFTAVLAILNGTMMIPEVPNAPMIVRQIANGIMGTSEIPVVNCTADGNFAPQQCKRNIDTHSESCYCVDRNGYEIPSNNTMEYGQQPCTSYDPTNIFKMLCANPLPVCFNNGVCVGEMDETPKLCDCPYGWGGIMCERPAVPDEPEEYTLCQFGLEWYNLLQAVIAGKISINDTDPGMTPDMLQSQTFQNMIINLLQQGRGTPTFFMTPVGQVSWGPNNGSLEVTLTKPNCSSDGKFAPVQCEYGMVSGDRHTCHCYTPEGKVIKGTKTRAPEYPQCRNDTGPQCPGVMCLMYCEHGFVKDMNGCDICQCRQPCDDKLCAHGTRCIPTERGPTCRPTMRKGMCPKEHMPNIDSLRYAVENSYASCEMKCQDDADCDDDMKCCGGCGNKCVRAFHPQNCAQKRDALLEHWQLYKNLTHYVLNYNMTMTAGNGSIMQSAMTWLSTTTKMWRPSCTPEGDYERVQCEYDTRFGTRVGCFCVEERGVRINGTETRPPMMPECSVKPGHCPMVTADQMGICVEACNEDYGCERNEKCCFNGCGKVCQAPVEDTMPDHGDKIQAFFSRVCSMVPYDNICQNGGVCAADWRRGQLCECPDTYWGPLCERQLQQGEEPPSLCRRTKAILDLIKQESYKQIAQQVVQLISDASNITSLPIIQPACDDEGFLPEQCDYDILNGQRKWCYCVNETGQPIPGSQTTGQPECGSTSCEIGYSLYHHENHTEVKCDPWSSDCPSGYECRGMALGRFACCISHHGHDDICRQAPNPGRWCPSPVNQTLQTRFFYNPRLQRCQEFNFRGCHGNKNNFRSMSDCENRCVTKVKPGTCPEFAKTSNQRYCKDNCDNDGDCTQQMKCCSTDCGRKCAHPKIDDDNLECELGSPLHYPNGTMRYCGRGQPLCPNTYYCEVDPLDGPSPCCPKKDEPVDVCQQPQDTGPCRAAFNKFYFDKDSKQCLPFVYGGCQGNGNNFDTIEECCKSCGTKETQCKPGVCPAPLKNYFASCAEECASDSDCPGETMCCSNGCGHSCTRKAMNNTKTCHMARMKAYTMMMKATNQCPMISIPRCNPDGSWQVQQCLDSYGVCWCVDTFTGIAMTGTIRRGDANCAQYYNRPEVAYAPDTPINLPDMTLFQMCPADQGISCCHASMCHMHRCPSDPSAVCRVNPCGGCHVEFFNYQNERIDCYKNMSQCELDREQAQRARLQHAFNMLPPMSEQIRNVTGMNSDLTGDDMMKMLKKKAMPDPPVPESVPARCQRQPGGSGGCKGFLPMWFFNTTTNRCEKYVYGCEGYDNLFHTVKECYQECHSEGDPCTMKDCGAERECKVLVDMQCNKGKCAHWAECMQSFSDPHLAGVYLPSCEYGSYAGKQCHHGYCWCVNNGRPMAGSLAEPFGVQCSGNTFTIVENKGVSCSDGSAANLDCVDACLNKVCPGHPKATCMVNLCDDNCDVMFMEAGKEVTCQEDECAVTYAQNMDTCHDFPMCPEGHLPSMCADVCAEAECPGNPCAVCNVDPCSCEPIFKDILTNATISNTDCEKITHSACEANKCQKMMDAHWEKMRTGGATTTVIPVCTDEGMYKPQQCDSDICWCVDGLGQWTKDLKGYDSCVRNEVESISITMTFPADFSTTVGKEDTFRKAFIEGVIATTGIPQAGDFITVTITQGSIKVTAYLADENLSPVVITLADVMEKNIRQEKMTMEWEGNTLTANAIAYTRHERFEGDRTIEPSTTPAPPTPVLKPNEIIIIAVVCGIVGFILLASLVYCCCCRRQDRKQLNSSQDSILYGNNVKMHAPPSMAVTNATYDNVEKQYPPPYQGYQDNIAYQPDSGDIVKVRL